MQLSNVRLYRWNPASVGGKALATSLGIRMINSDESKSAYKGGPDKVVINWGSSVLPKEVLKSRVLNSPIIIERFSNKKHFFENVSGKDNSPRIPEWTTDIKKALEWAKTGETVVSRNVLTGHSGRGIVFLTAKDIDEFLEAPLYTLYKKKKAEFRVHVAFGEVIDIQKKSLRKYDDDGNEIDPKTIDFRIQNLANGFIFARNDIDVPADVTEQALRTASVSGIDFGAIDIIWNDKEQKAYVLEVNFAPGLMNTTLEKYTNVFKQQIERL